MSQMGNNGEQDNHSSSTPGSRRFKITQRETTEGSNESELLGTPRQESTGRYPGMPRKRDGVNESKKLDNSPDFPPEALRAANHDNDVDFTGGKAKKPITPPSNKGNFEFLNSLLGDEDSHGDKAPSSARTKLGKAKQYAGHTKDGYRTFQDKGAKQYTGDIAKHTAKTTAKETGKYAAAGGIIGGIAGGIAGFSAGGVGTVPGAVAGAKTGASTGARFGAKKGASEGALDSATGRANPQPSKKKQNEKNHENLDPNEDQNNEPDPNAQQDDKNNKDKKAPRYLGGNDDGKLDHSLDEGSEKRAKRDWRSGVNSVLANPQKLDVDIDVKSKLKDKKVLTAIGGVGILLVGGSIMMGVGQLAGSTSGITSAAGGAGRHDPCAPQDESDVKTAAHEDEDDKESKDADNNKDGDGQGDGKKNAYETLSDDQKSSFNDIDQAQGLDDKGKEILVTIGMAETQLNVGTGDNPKKVGVFNLGESFGSKEDRLDTAKISSKLGEKLKSDVPDYKNMDTGDAAAKLTGTATPDKYGSSVKKAQDIIKGHNGEDTENKDEEQTNQASGQKGDSFKPAADVKTKTDPSNINIDQVDYTTSNNGAIQDGGNLQIETVAEIDDKINKVKSDPTKYGVQPGEIYGNNQDQRIDNVLKVIGTAKGFTGNDDEGKKLALYGVMVSKTETNWANMDYGDRDSVGMFQQRDLYGSKEDRTNPVKAAEMFYKGKSGIPGMMDEPSWKSAESPKDIAQAAQNVQRSAFPDGSNYLADYEVSKSLVDELYDVASKEGSGNGSEANGKGGEASKGNGNPECDSGAENANYTSGGGSGGWADPVQAPKTSPFGKRSLAGADAENGGHLGQDLGAPCGTDIHSASEGTVKDVTKDTSGGNIILIHNDETNADFMYVHMQEGTNKVKIGDKVEPGEVISKVGETGQAQGCHLHFQISDPATDKWFDQSKATDPVPWMKNKGINLGEDPVDKVVGKKEGGSGKGGGNSNADCNTSSGELQKGLDEACKYLDRPYSWGGGGLDGPTNGINGNTDGSNPGLDATSKEGFDCSSYVRFIIYQATGGKVEIPRVTDEQYAASQDHEVSKDDMKPGDLLFYGSPGALHHVTMYIGDGKMIEAANPTDGLRITNVNTEGDFYAATRPHEFN